MERAGHLLGVEITLLPHQIFKKMQLALVDEQRQLAGLGEIGLRREQRQRAQTLVLVARHRAGGDREQRAAEAIAGRVNPAVRQQRRDRVQRRHDAELAIVLHPEIAVLRARVFP